MKSIGLKNYTSPNVEVTIMKLIITTANILLTENKLLGLSFKKYKAGNMKPMQGLIVAPVNVIASPMFGIKI
jgi:hypothetical protein